ncbi:hypothetical protein MJ561_13525 [Klebsiella pneumoniae]|nr:hypothetical protein MJ561_13525 [Klebsiella pneumoniae]
MLGKVIFCCSVIALSGRARRENLFEVATRKINISCNIVPCSKIPEHRFDILRWLVARLYHSVNKHRGIESVNHIEKGNTHEQY